MHLWDRTTPSFCRCTPYVSLHGIVNATNAALPEGCHASGCASLGRPALSLLFSLSPTYTAPSPAGRAPLPFSCTCSSLLSACWAPYFAISPRQSPCLMCCGLLCSAPPPHTGPLNGTRGTRLGLPCTAAVHYNESCWVGAMRTWVASHCNLLLRGSLVALPSFAVSVGSLLPALSFHRRFPRMGALKTSIRVYRPRWTCAANLASSINRYLCVHVVCVCVCACVCVLPGACRCVLGLPLCFRQTSGGWHHRWDEEWAGVHPPVCAAARLGSESRKTPHHPRESAMEVGIFTSSLAGTMRGSGRGPVKSCLHQVGMLSNYPHAVVIRALHTAVCRVCATSPWYAEHTMRAAYAVGHHLPCAREHACHKIFHWLKANAIWEGDLCTDAVIWDEFRPEGYTTLPRCGAAAPPC